MKTPIDAASAGATAALLNGNSDFQMVDLWKITLNGGGVVLWHGGPVNTPIGFTAVSGQSTAANGSYLAGPVIERSKITTKLGLEVATLDLSISATAADLINGAPLIPFAQGRGFDGATAVLYRGYLADWSYPYTLVGATIEFSGRVTALKDVSRAKFTMTVSSWTVLLNVNMGPDVYQAGCLNTHYDADCGLTATNVAGTASGGATTTGLNTSLTEVDGYFAKGTISFTSGPNAGLSRAVQSYTHASGAVTVAFPLPYPPSSGDAFTAVRGCLLTMADCAAQSNLARFRGQPFTPPAITGNGV